MDANIINSYFKKVPAVICTAGSYIAAKNLEAGRRLGWLSEGSRLFERMDPENVLKYEAHFASSREGEVFFFSVNGADGAWFAVAIFDSICSRRFSEILFFREKPDMEKVFLKDPQRPSNEEMAGFASVLLGISDESFEPEDKRGLIDLRKSTVALLERLEDTGIFASYSENREMELSYYMPEDIPMSTYLQMVMMMLFAMDGIGVSSSLDVKLCRFGGNAELRISADFPCSLYDFSGIDELSRLFPSAAACLSVCNYIAGIANCTLEVKTCEETDRFSLVLSFKEHLFPDVDFKSRDPLAYFGECFEFVKKYVLRLRSGDAQ